MENFLESDELRVRQSLLHSVGRICEEEGLPIYYILHTPIYLTSSCIAAQKQQREQLARPRPAMSKEALALLADLVYKQSEVMATELQFFARHANRKMIKPEDVILCARKHPNLTNLLQKYQRENLSSSSTNSKKRRRQSD
ncbi:Centromere protein S [Phytophthora boehmeriae]|uniref:Centromere protein S n=1 Tax=Phytophthora boehmeriae TaxID=109152 RepID=A0A8T1X0N9_9STRA|nr:Centromere protein S [Phytophthora boehmeriae]